MVFDKGYKIIEIVEKKKKKGSDLVEKERIKKIFLLIKIYSLHPLIFAVQFKKKKKNSLSREFLSLQSFKKPREFNGQKKKKRKKRRCWRLTWIVGFVANFIFIFCV